MVVRLLICLAVSVSLTSALSRRLKDLLEEMKEYPDYDEALNHRITKVI